MTARIMVAADSAQPLLHVGIAIEPPSSQRANITTTPTVVLMAASSLSYTPLGDPSSNIRLLEVYVRDSAKRPRVTCRMRTVPLDSVPPFSALSYVWGDSDERAKIVVNGQLVSVTKSLEGALHCAPQLHKMQPNSNSTFLLWVDAVCINQSDTRERTAQVGLMAKLYQQAYCVFAWLGLEDDDPAFRALRSIIQEINRMCEDQSFKEAPITTALTSLEWLSGYPELCKNKIFKSRDPKIPDLPTLFNESWSAINTLLRRKYWTRVWIFQEAVLAKRLILACPTSAMVFRDLGAVAIALESVQWYLRHLPSSKPDFLGSAAWYFLRDIMDWSLVAKIMREQNARKAERLPHEWFRRFATSVVGLELDATDPRDHVYGLLALTELVLKPDYSKTLSQVATDFSLAWLKACQSSPLQPELVFLSYAGIGIFGEHPSLPSWVPNFQNLSQLKVKMMLYKSNRGVLSDLTTPSSIDTDAQALTVSGVQFDTVARVHDIMQPPSQEINMIDLMDEMKAISSIFSGKKSLDNIEDRKPSNDPEKVANTASEHHDWEDGIKRLYLFLVDFMAKHKDSYVTGLPPLQVVLRVLWCHTMTQKVLGSTIMRGINFLKMLATYGPRPTAEENLQDLGFTLDDSFDTTFCKQMFPIDGLEHQISAYKGSLLREFEDWEPIGGLTEMTELHTRLGNLGRSCGLMETSRGYLGLGPKGAKPGDLVTVLKGSEVPVLLRRHGTHFKHVGTSFILGLMDGELIGCVEKGEFAVEGFTIL